MKSDAPARVKGLSHFGMYVRDIEKMTAFYRDFLGMTIAKRSADGSMVFLCADFEREDHEIALMKGRSPEAGPKLIQQISFRVENLDAVREFYRRVRREGYRVQSVVSHASSVGCYFYDPEDNVVEVCCWTGHAAWQATAEPVDLERSNEEIMAQVDAHWARVKDVPVGGRLEPVPA
ncbi:MAG TPA: VOC family protein [Chloroflexota bacterium]|nr:VOC family protein [Chloroflexota bacterium]